MDDLKKLNKMSDFQVHRVGTAVWKVLPVEATVSNVLMNR